MLRASADWSMKKPMSTQWDENLKIATFAQHTGKKLMIIHYNVVFSYRYDDGYDVT